MKRISLVGIICFMVIAPALFTGNKASARVEGVCSNCHTMHNSQGGAPMNFDASATPNATLLRGDCVGCHSSATNSTYYDLGGCDVPVVLYTGGEPSTYLAGGNFYWVKEGLGGDDTKGHNVFLGEDDDFLNPSTPAPGGFSCSANDCHMNLSQPSTGSGYGDDITGKYGCEGCHSPAHHANDHANGDSGLVDTEAEGWYRFLGGIHYGGSTYDGVHSYEDGHWEADASASVHNEYLGNVSGAGIISANPTVSGFCAACHGMFHGTSDTYSGGSWIRHPSDAVIPDAGEYADAGGPSHAYDPLSPVAKAVIDSTPDATVTPGSDIVMCLSCHRPHGSPNSDMLRWDYNGMQAGGGGETGTGCFYCHTEKDGS